jgi:5-methyltetrahydrofolate--homocysteine methyltransferase
VELAEADYRGALDLRATRRAITTSGDHPAGRGERHHPRLFAAGADMVSTNTFSANRISQADYARSIWWARSTAHPPRSRGAAPTNMLARDGRARSSPGRSGPTNKTLSLSPDVNDPGFRESISTA